MTRIAFFDFDGTITSKDTLLSFIRFTHGPFRLALGFILNAPWLLAMRLHLVSNHQAKQRILTFFYAKRSLESFDSQCREFNRDVLPGLVRPKAANELLRLQNAGFKVVIVSASPENWIIPWATETGADCIGTQLETTVDNKGIIRLTGKISGANCHGKEKPRRIRRQYDLSGANEIYAYGDSRADLPLLSMGTVRFYKPFH
ncbi:MAG TPA: HAD-IB family hydrolase [Puia sp.]|uniref:HAD-IB family hydrolase n=1 Tax=Puia sp. TaxID=2045100 RepID=UPI002C4A140E|nr:HAD-IB family hydrolase [Puia sp.]HVU95074.1 HAD-IB family hydrolase [Puia sp.]